MKLDAALRERIRDLKGQGLSYSQIAARVGLGRSTVKHQFLAPEVRLRMKEHDRQRQTENRAVSRALRAAGIVRSAAVFSVPAKVPVSLTAAIFGDPLPGRSALDLREHDAA